MPSKPNRQPARTKLDSSLYARNVANIALHRILNKSQGLEEAVSQADNVGLEPRDRAYALRLVRNCVRRLGQIDALLAAYLTQPIDDLPQEALQTLRLACAELLWLEIPDHAAVNSAVELIKSHQPKLAGLANAVLKNIAKDGAAKLESLPISLNTPSWLLESWRAAYGEQLEGILAAHLVEPPLDITCVNDIGGWAEKLGGEVIGAQTIRLCEAGAVTSLAGYDEGAWWVQDVAAALPAQLFDDIKGKRVLDICAAPGGKTMQLAAMGADVTAIDISKNRLRRLEENLTRCNLKAEVICVDALTYEPEQPFDAILLDAPCSATGTVRKHPDIAYHRKPEDIEKLSALQAKLLAKAYDWLAPGGQLVYAVCSLQPEEGERQIERFLKPLSLWERGWGEGSGSNTDNSLSPHPPTTMSTLIPKGEGTVRTLPSDMPEKGGMDGFFMAKLIKK